MSSLKARIGRKTLVAIAFLLALTGGLWWQRMPLLKWHYLRGLAQAEDSQKHLWAERIAALEEEAVPGLVQLLKSGDAKVCGNCQSALAALAHRMGLDSARTAAVAREMTSRFDELGLPGREAVLEWQVGLLLECTEKRCAALEAISVVLLERAAQVEDLPIRLKAFTLAEALLSRSAAVNIDLCRALALGGLECRDAAGRARGIRLVMQPPLKSEAGMLDRIVPFLKDGAPEVRRQAVLALGLAEEIIGVEGLLPLLQDADADVRRLSETALRGRGLQDAHIKLAKLITDSRDSQRLQVVHHLKDAEDIDPGTWLLHLGRDPSPAVRAAALRFAGTDPSAAHVQQQLLQLGRVDPSLTVRQLADFYLETRRPPP